MNIELKHSNATNATLTVKLTEQDYAQEVANKIKDYSKKAQIKGFRPGKVPVALIQKMYGKSLLIDQINEMLGKQVNQYIRENKLRLLGDPLPRRDEADHIDWDTQRDFTFHYDLGLVPDFEVPVNKNFVIDAYEISLDQGTIDQTYEHLQKQQGKMENPEKSEKGDFLYGELKQESSDFSAKTLIPLNQVKANEDRFIGVTKGDIIFFDMRETFGDNDAAIAHVTGLSKEAAKDLKGEFEFTVDKINRQGLSELNQELFDKVFGEGAVNGEEEFKAKVQEVVQENYQREAQNLLYRHIIEKLIKDTNIEIPTDFLKRWVKQNNEKPLNDEELTEAVEGQLESLKWNLIRNRLAEQFEIKLEEKEIVERAKAKIRQQLNVPESPELDGALESYAHNYLQQENGKNFQEEQEGLLTDKVLQNILPNITINAKPITAGEFRELTF
jgi:trigger factor